MKPSDKKRRRILIGSVFVLLCAAAILCADRLYLFLTAAANRLRFGVTTVVSPLDADGDGLDDGADIMLGARRYIRTNPVYAPGYFDGGYPPDGHGVCADVVWRALDAAGYDLKALIDRDIAADQEAYNLAAGRPDLNIDFRRVVNIETYLRRHGLSLTLDTGDLEAWQRGDFVIYEGHIAIVSDRRNANGIPYIIHHPGTGAEEADALESRPIIGHYRWNP